MSYDIKRVKQAFTANPELFVHTYFPQAKREGTNMCIGDVHGSEGKSLKISIGKLPGTFKDFGSSNDGGDLIDLLMANKGLSLNHALTEIANLYKIPEEMDMKANRKPIKPTKPLKKTAPLDSLPAFQKYLVEERGIRKETIEKYQISGTSDGFIAYPVIGLNQKVLQHSYISLKRDEKGKKNIKQDEGAYHYCFGMHLVNPNTRQIVITEGQIDCMTAYQAGIKNVISIPMGTGSINFIDTHWDFFAQCDDIVLCFDMDDAGRDYTRKVVKRLGIDKCRIVELGENDLNLCWNLGDDEQAIQDYITNAKHQENELIYSIGSNSDRTRDFLKNKDLNEGDDFFLQGLELKQRMGELTIWTGYSGCGKTTLLNQQMLNLLETDNKYKIFYASYEQNTHDLELLFLRQMGGSLFEPHIDAYLDFVRDKVYDYIPSKDRTISELFKTMLYALNRYGCNIFVVDNLVTCGIPEGDYERQQQFVNELLEFCKDHEVSIHLVAHSRKSDKDDGETRIPCKSSVRGTSAITDICHNGLTVWRNPDTTAETTIDEDGLIKVWKQRETGVMNTVRYYFNGAFKSATTDESRSIKPINL